MSDVIPNKQHPMDMELIKALRTANDRLTEERDHLRALLDKIQYMTTYQRERR